MTHALRLRQAATQATRDRFIGRPFQWGRDDCGRMAIFHMKALDLAFPVAKMGAYSTALGAKRALARLGLKSLDQAADAQFARIAPAEALIGDLIMLDGDQGFGALTIAVGNGRVLGWHEDAPGAAILQPIAYSAAWRVLPL